MKIQPFFVVFLLSILYTMNNYDRWHEDYFKPPLEREREFNAINAMKLKHYIDESPKLAPATTFQDITPAQCALLCAKYKLQAAQKFHTYPTIKDGGNIEEERELPVYYFSCGLDAFFVDYAIYSDGRVRVDVMNGFYKPPSLPDGMDENSTPLEILTEQFRLCSLRPMGAINPTQSKP